MMELLEAVGYFDKLTIIEGDMLNNLLYREWEIHSFLVANTY